MSRYKPYPQYKGSGVEWLGEVPEHWNIFQIKRSIDGCSNGIWGEEPNGLNDLIVIRVADFNRDNFTISEEKLTYRAIEEKDRCNRLLKQNDLLIEKSGGGENQLVGTVVSFNKDFLAVTSNFVAKMTCKNDFNARYLTYSFAHLYAKRVNYMSIKQTTGIQNLDSNQYLSEYWSFPPFLEQQSIANFLDNATCKIDTLIHKQQNLIELLKEKRQALISHVVTKGLNPHVKMKNSGVEWLGEVPEHWEVSKIGFLSNKIGSGKTPKGGSEVYSDEGIIFIRSQNVYDEGLRLEDVVFISKEIDEEMSNTRVRPGDILLNVTGASIGRTTLVPYNFDVANVNQHVCIIRINSIEMRPYISLVMKSTTVKIQIDAFQNGAAREGLNFEQIANIQIALPSISEQIAITNYLDNSTCKIDTLMAKAEKAIELLKEQRTALISATVTGKIDVRGIAS